MMRKVQGLIFAILCLSFHYYFIFPLRYVSLLRLFGGGSFSIAYTKYVECFGLRKGWNFMNVGRARSRLQDDLGCGQASFRCKLSALVFSYVLVC